LTQVEPHPETETPGSLHKPITRADAVTLGTLEPRARCGIVHAFAV
jgi:hypothetical protein